MAKLRTTCGVGCGPGRPDDSGRPALGAAGRARPGALPGELGAARRIRPGRRGPAHRRRARAAGGDGRADALGPSRAAGDVRRSRPRPPRARGERRLPGPGARPAAPVRGQRCGRRRAGDLPRSSAADDLAFDHADDPGCRDRARPREARVQPAGHRLLPGGVHGRGAAARSTRRYGASPSIRATSTARSPAPPASSSRLEARPHATAAGPLSSSRAETPSCCIRRCFAPLRNDDSGTSQSLGDRGVPLSSRRAWATSPSRRSSRRPRWPGARPGRCRSRTVGSGDRCASAPGCAPTSHPCGHR